MTKSPITASHISVSEFTKEPYVAIYVTDPAVAEAIANHIVEEAKEAVDCEAYEYAGQMFLVSEDIKNKAADLRQELMSMNEPVEVVPVDESEDEESQKGGEKVDESFWSAE